MNTKFLRCVLIIAVTGLLNTACKKSDSVPPVYYTTLKVLEFKTNLPLAGAKVEIYKCTKHGFGGCSDISLLRTLSTDKDGNFQFDSKLDVFFVNASHQQYWDGSSGGETLWGDLLPVTNIYLAPVAYTKIHLKKVNPHASGLSMVLNVKPDSSTLYGSTAAFSLPADTTFAMASHGNINNVVSWYFINGMGNVDTTEMGGQLPSYYINRFDTASVEINY
jgi:hypothetical protein